MDNMKHRRLQELDRSDFEIVDGQPDIRGWDVRNSRGQKVGEVEDLIVDAQQKKVRYMVVDLDDNELDLDDRKVLIPIGLAELHREDDDVLLPGVQSEQLRSLPVYDRDRLDEEAERKICTALGRSDGRNQRVQNMEPEPEFYRHDYFNDDNLYRNRMRENAGNQNRDSEYERGLRLWERRSEGGILPAADTSESRDHSRFREGDFREREIDERARMEMVRNRRNSYEQRRGWDRQDRYGRDNSVERRISNEGLRDPDDL
ncbi:MAG TPA: PRC-barrel domain-containing protein [Flavisolibacter sp.]|nr:PRC-barrel domain-containing protein [Flavisolibacter sp.]